MELILIKIDAILIVILVHCIYDKDGVRIFISYVSGEMMCGDYYWYPHALISFDKYIEICCSTRQSLGL